MAEALTPHLPQLLWLVPLLPMIAAGVIAMLPNGCGKLASKVALGALFGSCLIALIALVCTLAPSSAPTIATAHHWFCYGDEAVKVGVLLDPMSASMAAMVTFVAFCIFVYSTGYMETEQRFGRFFGFLSLFCGAMLMLVLANSLLLLFMAWELVGLASYLLIGFYFKKPAAAAAAQKAFITTRVGDMAFLIGMIWLYRESGTLMFYDGGTGLLETNALESLAAATTCGGLAVSAGASLLLLVGAMGKSGQVPLHTWLPDAMEGPTPVSALIHAATMVAAGVFLVARTHPIFQAAVDVDGASIALSAAAWIGGVTALYAALVAMAQTDIKRILAYSTVSQLGFMMIALGTGGVAAAMLHLICHAFFKALLFLSAGSVIHGCHDEQDIRKMGGLRKTMPKTFLVYAIGMMALSGFPFFFSGFWSKEAVLHSAQVWQGGIGPFLLAVAAALLTAFYMTRQALMVFFGSPRKPGVDHPHESPKVMLVPLYVLAAGAVLLSVIGTPMWQWFEKWMGGEAAEFDGGALFHGHALGLLGVSLAIVTVGVGASWKIYRNLSADSNAPDPLEEKLGGVWGFLVAAMGFDTLYEKAIIKPLASLACVINSIERNIFVPLMAALEGGFKLFGRLTGSTDEKGLNRGFDGVCSGMKNRASSASDAQVGRPQGYLRAIGLGMSVLLILYFWLSA
ncbi:MAG: NADH-quinone oxidoreductase subunit L [Verrucomicrobiae bacterium]|nr:NADH-quinone oxidoreductase subunit L [Verrucomicrobiae bacterium]NNJ43063.1 NADH-quinone oxidoreductase subunit L [Akkermansiaceae bacterium]